MLAPELVVGYYIRLACVDLDLKNFKTLNLISPATYRDLKDLTKSKP